MTDYRWLTPREAAEALGRGEVVLVPTDTVWGLAVDPFSGALPEALAGLKGRDAAKPIAWLVSDRGDLECYGLGVSPAAGRLADEFWPGELTLVVRAADAVPPAFRTPTHTIGLRWAAYWPLQILMERLEHPLAVTSANPAGARPPQRLSEVDPRLLAETAGVLGPPANEGFVASGVASTVLDCTGDVPEVLRQGTIDWSRIAETLDMHPGRSDVQSGASPLHIPVAQCHPDMQSGASPLHIPVAHPTRWVVPNGSSDAVRSHR